MNPHPELYAQHRFESINLLNLKKFRTQSAEVWRWSKSERSLQQEPGMNMIKNIFYDILQVLLMYYFKIIALDYREDRNEAHGYFIFI